jgi:TatD DNase family protein
MIDTHLYAEEFDEDRKEAIQRALNKITEFYLPAIDSESHEKMLQLEAEYPEHIFSMMGLHPVYVKPESWEKNSKLLKIISIKGLFRPSEKSESICTGIKPLLIFR